MGNEGEAGAVGEERQVQDHAVGRQARQRGQEVAHGQRGEIGDGDAALEPREVAARDGLQLPVEPRRASHDEHGAGARLQPEGNLEGRREIAFHHDAGDVLPERLALDIGAIGSAKDDRDSRKERSVPEQEVQRRTHDGDDQIRLHPPVLASEMVP